MVQSARRASTTSRWQISSIGLRAPVPCSRATMFFFRTVGPITSTSLAGKPASRSRFAIASAAVVTLPGDSVVSISMSCLKMSCANCFVASSTWPRAGNNVKTMAQMQVATAIKTDLTVLIVSPKLQSRSVSNISASRHPEIGLCHNAIEIADTQRGALEWWRGERFVFRTFEQEDRVLVNVHLQLFTHGIPIKKLAERRMDFVNLFGRQCSEQFAEMVLGFREWINFFGVGRARGRRTRRRRVC